MSQVRAILRKFEHGGKSVCVWKVFRLATFLLTRLLWHRPCSPVLPRLDAARSGCIDHPFGDTIESKVFFDFGFRQCHCAEWRETKPRGYQAKRLAEVPSLNHHEAIGARGAILPLRSRKYGGHEAQHRRI
jgi:hypothetical protein